jgi:restriction endonuclease S subunit
VIKKLERLANVETGLVVSRYKQKNDYEETFPYTVISLKSFEDFPHYDHQYAEEFIANKEITNDKYFPKKGDVVIRLRKPFHAVVIEHDYDNFICNAVTAIITINSDDILPKYLAYVLNTSIVYEQLENNISGSQHQLINTTDLRNLEIPLIDLDLQEKIVDYIQNLYEEKIILESLLLQKQDYAYALIEKVISIGTNK